MRADRRPRAGSRGSLVFALALGCAGGGPSAEGVSFGVSIGADTESSGSTSTVGESSALPADASGSDTTGSAGTSGSPDGGELDASTTSSSAPIAVLLLGDSGSQGQIETALTGAGYDVTTIVYYGDWNGAIPLPSAFDVVVYLDGVSWGNGLSAEADAALAAFVQGGGGLVRTEWSLFAQGVNPAIDALLPSTYEGSYTYGATWTVVDAAHPLAEGLPASFESEAGYSHGTATGDTTVVVDDGLGNPLAAVRNDVGGSVVHINHDLLDTVPTIEPPVLQLFVNAVALAAR